MKVLVVPKIQAIQGSSIPNAFGVIKERLNYPYTAMAHVSFNTRQFTSMPKRTYECYGLKVRIPKNYTPREKFGMITQEFFTLYPRLEDCKVKSNLDLFQKHQDYIQDYSQES